MSRRNNKSGLTIKKGKNKRQSKHYKKKNNKFKFNNKIDK